MPVLKGNFVTYFEGYDKLIHLVVPKFSAAGTHSCNKLESSSMKSLTGMHKSSSA